MISDSVSRRRVLLAAATAPLAVACTTSPEPPPPPDPLAELAAAARADAALASLMRDVPAATEVTKNRTEHATRLQAEVDRERPPVSSSPAPAPSTPPTPPDPVAALRSALDSSLKRATELVPILPAYRAGLVGSVAAGCASLLEVLS